MSDHFPVMLDEVLSNLSPEDGGVYVDGTFGAGGYTRAILKSSNCTVIAIDRDPSALARAEEVKEEFGDRFVFVKGCFGDALSLVKSAGHDHVDGFVLDVGVSSMQIDQADRGFSFRFDAPLDMRMDTANDDDTAADLVNNLPEEELASIIYRYGDERLSRRIARRIVKERSEKRIERTSELADIIRAVIPRGPKDKIDPATKTFQALRIAVNDELGELERGLVAAENLLKQDGRLVIVSFHSLEDSIVKSFMSIRSGYQANSSRHLPPSPEPVQAPSFTLPRRKAVEPSDAETQQNPRSRSAKLRMAIRNNNDAWEAGK